MKKLIILFLLVSINVQVSAQKTIYDILKVNYNDSLELNNIWIKFHTSISEKDSNKIRELSINTVYCPSCVNPDSFMSGNYFVSIDTFINQSLSDNSIFDSFLWNELKSTKYYLNARRITNYSPRNFTLKDGQPYEDYELFYRTREANHLTRYEGQSRYFTFVKINGKFVFTGTGTIP